MKTMTYPLIHMDGTSASDLLDALTNATLAIYEASNALVKTLPNDRDYPQGGFNDAVSNHRVRLGALDSIREELERIAENILNQQQLRIRARRSTRAGD